MDTMIQAMNPEIVERFCNQANTVAPADDIVRKESRPNDQVAKTATYGTPVLLVLLKIRGASAVKAMPCSIRLPENKKQFPDDQAEVKMAAFIT